MRRINKDENMLHIMICCRNRKNYNYKNSFSLNGVKVEMGKLKLRDIRLVAKLEGVDFIA